MFSRHPDDPLKVGLRLGTLDTDPGIRPSYRQFLESAVHWEVVDDELAHHQGQRPSA
jgi:hypothetical protein